MKRILVFYGMLLILLFLAGCSNSDSESSKSADSEKKMEVNAEDRGTDAENLSIEAGEADKTNAIGAEIESKRKVIYTAQLGLKVDSFDKTQAILEAQVKRYGGYIVDSEIYREREESLSGTMTFRIPEEYFRAFLNDAENSADKVTERTVNGNDITEEYVDFESRLKSKRVVEARLLDFMERAERTEDLLKVSSDLSKVQEEIEQIQGELNILIIKRPTRRLRSECMKRILSFQKLIKRT